MNEKTMNLVNKILYYIVAPILILEFILTDLQIITFTKILFIASVIVLLILCAISFLYKKKHPDYEFKANEMYTRILFAITHNHRKQNHFHTDLLQTQNPVFSRSFPYSLQSPVVLMDFFCNVPPY